MGLSLILSLHWRLNLHRSLNNTALIELIVKLWIYLRASLRISHRAIQRTIQRSILRISKSSLWLIVVHQQIYLNINKLRSVSDLRDLKINLLIWLES